MIEQWKIEQAVHAELRTGQWEHNKEKEQLAFVLAVVRRLVQVKERE